MRKVLWRSLIWAGLCVFAALGVSIKGAKAAEPAPAAPPPADSILVEYWNDIEGNTIDNLRGSPDFPDHPSEATYLKSFEFGPDRADSYGSRVRGWIKAPEDGEYTFWIASDDQGELYLSTSEDPKGKQKIASVGEWTNHREYEKTPSQKSAKIKLEKDKKYYIEALQKEGSGGDNLSVQWQLPSGAKEGPIPGTRLTAVQAPVIKPGVVTPPEPVQMTVTSEVPNSPGVHWLKGTCKWKGQEFPFAFGVYLSKDYFVSKDEKFPVICSMHNVIDAVGGSDGGDGVLYEGFGMLTIKDIGADTRHSGEWPPVKFNPRKEAKFIAVMPQCPKGKNFYNMPGTGLVVEQLNWVEKNFRTDPDRYFLTGFSYGGTSTWYVSTQFPERFAAIIPLSARQAPKPEAAPEILKDIGVWCAVGELDGGFRESCTKMNDLFVAAKHPNFHFTVIKGGQHHCYQSVYGNPDLWKWLAEQKRKPKAPAAEQK